MNVEETIKMKHAHQMEAHVSKHGPLGKLRTEPAQEQLDADFEDRRAKGSLFTQTRKQKETVGGQS